MKARWFAACTLALGLTGQALAIRIPGDPAPSPGAVQPPSTSPSRIPVERGSGLAEGMITKVSEKRDQVEINGSWIRISDDKTRVFRQGRAVIAADELVKGKVVKFTLAPGTGDTLTLGLVYVP